MTDINNLLGDGFRGNILIAQNGTVFSNTAADTLILRMKSQTLLIQGLRQCHII